MLNLVKKVGWRDCECPAEQGSVSVREARDVGFGIETSILDKEVANLANATGRVLARSILADSPLPRFDYSAMDGYAINAADITSGATLNVVGQAAAGRVDIAVRLKRNSAIRRSRQQFAHTRLQPPGSHRQEMRERSFSYGMLSKTILRAGEPSLRLSSLGVCHRRLDSLCQP
jgi:hypothetical protein